MKRWMSVPIRFLVTWKSRNQLVQPFHKSFHQSYQMCQSEVLYPSTPSFETFGQLLEADEPNTGENICHRLRGEKGGVHHALKYVCKYGRVAKQTSSSANPTDHRYSTQSNSRVRVPVNGRRKANTPQTDSRIFEVTGLHLSFICCMWTMRP